MTDNTHWQLSKKDNTDTLELHPQFVWADEFDWQALAQSEPTYTLTGAVDIQQGTKLAGRPITLSGDDAWVKRKLIKDLQTWADVPELTLELVHPDGRTFNVIFARPAIDNLTAIKEYRPADQSDDDWVRADLHFLTV